MKKAIIGAIVGGLLIFIWQTLSNTVLNLHQDAAQYTPKQDSIMNFLNAQFTETGQYAMPMEAPGASMDEREKLMKSMEGKPWAIVSYHKAYTASMVMNMIRTLITDIVVVLLFCLILLGLNKPRFGPILLSSLFMGAIAYFNIGYTQHIWYETPGQNGELTDALVSWGLCGIWLGWWLPRK